MWDERLNDEKSGTAGNSVIDTPETGSSFSAAGDMTDKPENTSGTASPAEVTGDAAAAAEVTGGAASPAEVTGGAASPAEVTGGAASPAEVTGGTAVNPFADAHSWNTGKYAGTYSGSETDSGTGSDSSGGFSNGGYTYSTRTDTPAGGAGGSYGTAGQTGRNFSYGSAGSAGAGGVYGSAGAAGRNSSYGSAGSAGAGGAYGSAGAAARNSSYGSAGSAGAGGAYGSAGAAGRNSSYGSAGAPGTGVPYGSGTTGRGNNAAGSGRYYDYSRNGSGNNGGAGGTGRGSNRRGRVKGRLAAILAVILFFILGAGAGAYISSRGSTASMQSSPAGAESKTEGSARTGEKTGKDGSHQGGSSQAEKRDADESAPVSTESLFSENPSIRQVEAVDAQAAGVDTVVADVAENVMPAIVSVFNKYTEEAQFFGHPYTQENESTGSGIIIGESDGEILIVTNNHVVEGADSLSVQFIDEENCQAALKGTNVSSDLAVIAVKLSDLSDQTKNSIAIAGLGDSDALRIGERVIAIGNALGYGQSVTVGYVSALNREFSEEDGITGTFIQTDAAINPGNSGGALLNAEGKVIGINSNKIGGNAIEGMGFAIPISKAIPIIDDLKVQESKTKVAEEERGVLGIRGISVTSDVASAYNMPVGAYVEEIVAESGAADSDLVKGDVITGVNGTEVTSMESLAAQLSYYSAGTEVTLTIQHPLDGGDYEEREVKVVLSKASDLPTQESHRDSEGLEQGELEEGIPDEDSQSLFPFMFGF